MIKTTLCCHINRWMCCHFINPSTIHIERLRLNFESSTAKASLTFLLSLSPLKKKNSGTKYFLEILKIFASLRKMTPGKDDKETKEEPTVQVLSDDDSEELVDEGEVSGDVGKKDEEDDKEVQVLPSLGGPPVPSAGDEDDEEDEEDGDEDADDDEDDDDDDDDEDEDDEEEV